MRFYKIQNKEGKFSTGGLFPKWTKMGKTWNSKAALNSHFALLRDGKGRWPYHDCELKEWDTSVYSAWYDLNEIRKLP